MALMFPRLARNFAKNGYFPTDEDTLDRALRALQPSGGPMNVIDPCAGEGAALVESATALGRSNVHAYAVEYEAERAAHARTLADRCLHSDLMDTVISRQMFGLLWLNPPYGDMPRDQLGGAEFQKRARLEKAFYQRSVPLLQYGGVLVFIIPVYTLDAELIGWITRSFANVRIFRAMETQFQQVVIFGQRVRQSDLTTDQARAARVLLADAATGKVNPAELPQAWPFEPYTVPSAVAEPAHFYQTKLEPAQFALEVHRLRGLWDTLESHLGASQRSWRRPARALSKWHLSLSLAAGAISGVVTSPNGRVLVVKGDTHKEKTLTTQYSEDENGSVCETRVLTDRFVPVIRAWDLTANSATRGQVLTIQ